MIYYNEEVKEQGRREIQGGKSQREIIREYGISRYTIQSWCGLRPETKLRQIAPVSKGRPQEVKTIEDYAKENERLKIESELLWDFLQSVERK
ncbi:MAG TPA: imidazolonepropionase [Firmicutes bacterium]|nr:imidazolonepropionase [Bacillota bacterium]